MASEEEINKAFDVANDFVTKGSKTTPLTLSNAEKLTFFALYKQATSGACTGAQPSRLNIVARAKYDAWKELGSMNQKDAKLKYIDELKKKVPQMKAKL